MSCPKERIVEPEIKRQMALASFYIGREETLIFWLDGDSPETQVEHVSLGREEIAEAARKLHFLFSPDQINPRRPERTTDMSWLNPIGEKLLGPLADRLAKCSTLIVSPHAELHLIPLHLLSPTGGVPLGITHSITYVANLSFYALLLSRSAAKVDNFTVPSLCLSTAAVEDCDPIHQSFAIAPRAFAEKTGGIFLQGINATGEAFIHYAESAKSLYLSCHGHFDINSPLESALFLSDGRSLPSYKQGNSALHRLSVRDILGMHIGSRLVILDACMSGNQRFSPGDEPIGFPTAFLLSGTSAVIASSWSVEQNYARCFMLALLDHWSSGSSIGQAMQKAYSATKAKSEHGHPFHWAAFSLFGNDRLPFNLIGIERK